MAHLSLRPFGSRDIDQVRQWYGEDRDGLEALLGAVLPDELAWTLALNRLLQAQQQGRAVLRMIDRAETPIGLCVGTWLSEARDHGSVSLYVEPSSRRYSIAAAKMAEAFAKDHGMRRLVGVVLATNRRALGLAKRMGYLAKPGVLLLKELDG